MSSRLISRNYLLLVLFFVIFGLFFSVAYAGDVLFETVMPWYYWWSGINWGGTSFTLTSQVAVTYQPLTDQEVCMIKLGLYKSGSPADNVVMTVMTSVGNGYPVGNQVIATAIVSAEQVSGSPITPQQSAYTAFTFSPCLNFISGTRYSLVLSRTQPNASNFYVGQLSNLVSYRETSFWAYTPVNGGFQEKVGYEPALRLEGPEPQNREPIIIVPGILGSRLNRVSDGEEVWPSIVKMIDPFARSDDYLDDLKMDNSGEEIIDINSSEIIENILSVNQYGNLIQKFKDAGYQLGRDLFVVPYDWRLDITTSALVLDSTINQAIINSPTDKINIVAHSMGGLLVKDYLMRNGDSSVNKLIFAGTPHLGAPKAFNALNYGDDFDLRFLAFGLNKNKAKEIAQNMPAVYELLPSREYVSKVGSYIQNSQINLGYDQTNQFMISDPILSDYRNSNLLNVADRFHQSHDSWLPQSASVYNLMGCREYDTIGSFKIDSDGSVDIDSISGDGTVPLISAEHVPGKNYFVSYPETKINHTGLISDDRTISLIYDFVILDNEPVLPAGISKTSADCDNILKEVKSLRFSTHSPVSLHVYDNLGNRTGLTAEGNIETNIPDSDFVQVGDSSFVFVPDETEYSIEIDAYATGSFDFKIKELKNGQVGDSIIYDDIQINNPGLKASFEFSSIASSGLLSVDENGDGEVDVGYSSDGERILYRGIENVISDISMAYELGWISTKREKDSFLRKLEKVIIIENKIEKIMEILPDGAKRERRIQRLEKKIDRVLAIQFLKDLEKSYNKKQINELAYNLIKEDILWLLRD